jgi:hypothetical protein
MEIEDLKYSCRIHAAPIPAELEPPHPDGGHAQSEPRLRLD